MILTIAKQIALISENIFTGSFSPAPYESYTKEKKKKNTHEDKGENGYGIW